MKRQRGISLIGLILSGTVIISVAIVSIKTAPSVLEYLSILKVIRTMDASGELKAGSSIADIRKSFERRAYIDAVTSISGADLDVSKEGNNLVVSFQYEKKIPIVGNVSLCIDYSGRSSSRARDL